MSRLRPAGIVASVALVLIAVALAVAGGDDGESSAPLARSSGFVGLPELEELEGTLGHPIYWAGDRPPSRIEATTEPDGSVYLRYLPPGVGGGEEQTTFLTVGTYPVPDAQSAVRRAASAAGADLDRVEGGAVVFTEPDEQRSAYLAYPDSDLQIEVYHPTPGRARDIVNSGLIQAVSR